MAPVQPDPAAPAIPANDRLIDLEVGDIERPATEEDRCVREEVALTEVDSAHRPAPSRLRKGTLAVVLDDAAKERHDVMLSSRMRCSKEGRTVASTDAPSALGACGAQEERKRT